MANLKKGSVCPRFRETEQSQLNVQKQQHWETFSNRLYNLIK